MKKARLLIIFLILSCKYSNAQILNEATAEEFIIKYHRELGRETISGRLIDDEGFNIPILNTLPTLLSKVADDAYLRKSIYDLTYDIYSNSPNATTKTKAINLLLDFIVIEKDLGIAISYIERPLSVNCKKEYFNEEAIVKLLKILEKRETLYSSDTDRLLRLVGIIGDKRFVQVIKSRYLTNCKDGYKRQNTCFHAKSALVMIGDKTIQKEIYANLSKIDSKLLANQYLESISYLKIPESLSLLTKVMNDNTCKIIYDFDTNKEEPCAAKVINTIVEMTSNIPEEYKKGSIGGYPTNQENIEQAKKWITKNKSKLKMDDNK
jgi:hypothetical protein